MKIEPGKWYKTRSGEKVFVAGRLPMKLAEMHGDYLGIIEGTGHTDTWDEDGLFVRCSKDISDLVEEWHEPRELTTTVLLCQYPGSARELYTLTKPMDHPAPSGTIVVGRKRVTIREGEGV